MTYAVIRFGTERRTSVKNPPVIPLPLTPFLCCTTFWFPMWRLIKWPQQWCKLVDRRSIRHDILESLHLWKHNNPLFSPPATFRYR